MGNGEIISAFCAGQLRVDKELAQCRRIIHCTRDFLLVLRHGQNRRRTYTKSPCAMI